MLKGIQPCQIGGIVRQSKIILFLVTMLVFLLSVTHIAFADNNYQKVDATNEVVKVIAVVDGLSIYQYEDGRIKGVTNQAVSEEQTKRILSEMGFTVFEISKMPSELQQEIVKGGGKKVELTLLKWTRELHDPDGEVVVEVIYDGNKDLPDISAMSLEKVPYLDLYSIYRSQTSTYADYDYYAMYDWEIGSPMLGFKDINAIAWDSNTRFLDDSSYVAKYRNNAISQWQDAWKQLEHNISGAALHFDCITQPYGQYGYIRERVRVPRGETVNCIQKYAHKTSPGSLGVVIGPLGITFNGSGYEVDTKRFALNVN